MESINNTVKGTDIVNVTDNIEQKTSEITIYGNTTQTVTKGKNLFDPNIQMFDNKSINENGEIVENSDTKVTDYILILQLLSLAFTKCNLIALLFNIERTVLITVERQFSSESCLLLLAD